MHQQRKTLRAGELDPHRKELLDLPEAGMVWEPGKEAWENKLAALRSYRRATGHLAPRQDAVWTDPADGTEVPIGQYMANLRRKGGLGKDPKRAEQRAKQLTAIDPDWNCPWPLNWQRHYPILADLVDADGHLPCIAPGVTFEGDDIGTARWRQQEPGTWAQLMPEQRKRLSALGIKGPEAPPPAPEAAHPGKGPEQCPAGVPAGPYGPGAVGGTGRPQPAGAARPHRGDRDRRRDGVREAGRMGLQPQAAAGQAHRSRV